VWGVVAGFVGVPERPGTRHDVRLGASVPFELVEQVLLQLFLAAVADDVHHLLGTVVRGEHGVPGQSLWPVVLLAVVEDLLDRDVRQISKQQEPALGAIPGTQRDLQRQRRLVACGSSPGSAATSPLLAPLAT
jgi:hypothetical protein